MAAEHSQMIKDTCRCEPTRSPGAPCAIPEVYPKIGGPSSPLGDEFVRSMGLKKHDYHFRQKRESLVLSLQGPPISTEGASRSMTDVYSDSCCFVASCTILLEAFFLAGLGNGFHSWPASYFSGDSGV